MLAKYLKYNYVCTPFIGKILILEFFGFFGFLEFTEVLEFIGFFGFFGFFEFIGFLYSFNRIRIYLNLKDFKINLTFRVYDYSNRKKNKLNES